MAMIINPVVPLVDYVATGGQTVFAVPFEFFANADLQVYDNGVLQTLTTHYTVTGAGVTGGGNVTFTSGRTVGHEIKIVRSVPIQRTTDFPTSGPFDIERLNEELDRIIAIQQEFAALPGLGQDLVDAAAASAAAAASSASSASSNASLAGTARATAQTHATNAATSATNAATSATNAANSATAASGAGASAGAAAGASAAASVGTERPWKRIVSGDVTVSVAVATLVVTLPAGWKYLRLHAAILPSQVALDNTVMLQISTDGGSTWKSGASDYGMSYIYQNNATISSVGQINAAALAIGLQSTLATSALLVNHELGKIGGTSPIFTVGRAQGVNGTGLTSILRAGVINFADATHIRIYCANGNVAAGSRLLVEYI